MLIHLFSSMSIHNSHSNSGNNSINNSNDNSTQNSTCNSKYNFHKESKKGHKLEIILAIICLLFGMSSGVGLDYMSWYNSLEKPFFTPPSWLFAPVWTILYIMMGVAFAKIIESKNKIGVVLFISQFICNLMWSKIFFSYKRIDIALYDILLLWSLLFLTIFHMRKNFSVFIMLLPYFLWVSFATVLNMTIFTLN